MARQPGGGGPWGGGPWGGGSGGNGPWGGGRPGGGGSGGPPPDFEELLRKSQDQLRRFMPSNFGGKSIGLLLLVVLVIWAASGFYRVQSDEVGVVKRFGEFVAWSPPGLHYHLPWPIEEVQRPKVTVERREEIGFRGGVAGRDQGRRDIAEESLMLTGDENIVDIDFTVTWNIGEREADQEMLSGATQVAERPNKEFGVAAANFLFNLRDPANTVRVAAESAMREVIGQTAIQVALTEGRQAIEERTLNILQQMLNDYGAGIRVIRVQLLSVDPPGPVVDAFNDVQRARADRERLRNEAEAYRNQVIPQARGEAERKIQNAEAYREEIVNRAEGDAQRFTALAEAYRQAPEVVGRRLYLETMEQVLRDAPKILLDGGTSGSGVVPYLPLPELQRRQGDNQTGAR